MSNTVEVLDQADVMIIVHEMYKINPTMIEELFNSFLISRYGITLETFDKVIHQTIPEEFL